MTDDPRFEILEVWRRPIGEEGRAAVRVLARIEAGAYGPEEYAVGVSTDPDSVFDPVSEETDVFSGLTFAEAHWVAAVIASNEGQPEQAEDLLFDLRVPVDLEWRDIDLSSVVVEPGGVRSTPLVPWEPDDAPSATRWAIATYTLDCGHQAVEMLRQDPDSAPFWVEQGAVDHLAARDARSLARLLLESGTLEEAQALVESAQANLATHPEEHSDDDSEGSHGH
ncbi:MAG: hypothetical protein ACOYL4_06205 [Miltoncostaeaceae bacterium]